MGQRQVGGEAYNFGLDVRQGVGRVARVRDQEEPMPLDQVDQHRHRSVWQVRGQQERGRQEWEHQAVK